MDISQQLLVKRGIAKWIGIDCCLGVTTFIIAFLEIYNVH